MHVDDKDCIKLGLRSTVSGKYNSLLTVQNKHTTHNIHFFCLKYNRKYLLSNFSYFSFIYFQFLRTTLALWSTQNSNIYCTYIHYIGRYIRYCINIKIHNLGDQETKENKNIHKTFSPFASEISYKNKMFFANKMLPRMHCKPVWVFFILIYSDKFN